MSAKTGCGGCLLSLAGIWIAMWLFVRIIELCPRIGLMKDLADGFVFLISGMTYCMVLIVVNIMEAIRFVLG
jgi:hypothetical protein